MFVSILPNGITAGAQLSSVSQINIQLESRFCDISLPSSPSLEILAHSHTYKCRKFQTTSCNFFLSWTPPQLDKPKWLLYSFLSDLVFSSIPLPFKCKCHLFYLPSDFYQIKMAVNHGAPILTDKDACVQCCFIRKHFICKNLTPKWKWWTPEIQLGNTE